MKQRVITAAVLIAVLCPCVYLGGWFFKVAAFALVAIGTNEIIKLLDKEWPQFFKYSIYVINVAAGYLASVSIDYVIFVLCVALIYYFFISEFYEKVSLNDIALLFMILFMYSFLLAGIYRMYEYSRWLVFLMIGVTELTDCFALFSGKAFGKHKVNVRISPNKTIEGCIGGYICGVIIGLVFSFIALKEMNRAFIFAACFTMPFIGQIGDLAFSEIKRFFNIKDFGKIFPGHGGVNDRIDSIVFNSMWLYALMSVML